MLLLSLALLLAVASEGEGGKSGDDPTTTSPSGEFGSRIAPRATTTWRPAPKVTTKGPAKAASPTTKRAATAAPKATPKALPRLVATTVEVPNEKDGGAPFDRTRQLTIPAGYAIEVYARVRLARFLLPLPNGDLLVSQHKLNKVSLISKDPDTGFNVVSDFLTGGTMPHDMVLHPVGGKDYIYISEADKVARYPYKIGDKVAGEKEIIVPNLPNPKGLRHPLKNIAIGNNSLYVCLGSASNDDTEDLVHDPKYAAIYAYTYDGKNRRLVTEGVRNAEGLAFVPDTNDLWVVVNQRDEVQYPYKDDTGNYGRVTPDYVDDHPPEEFTKIIEGKNYGWPYCNPEPSESMNDLSYVADAKRNADSKVKDCNQFAKVMKGMEPHSAPLGLSFWTGEDAPPEFRNGALVGMHGSWNRRTFSGHKVAFFPWVNNRPGKQYDLVTGWVTDPIKQKRWGRPVDMAIMPDGSMVISDDSSGTVYRMYRE